jgi:hypothetical protein
VERTRVLQGHGVGANNAKTLGISIPQALLTAAEEVFDRVCLTSVTGIRFQFSLQDRIPVTNQTS